MVFIGPSHPKSFRGAIEKHQNGPEPFGPMKYGVNSAPWFETENSRFETGDPFWPGFILSNRPTGPPGSTGSSSVRQTRQKPLRLATSDPENHQRRVAFAPSPRQTHPLLMGTRAKPRKTRGTLEKEHRASSELGASDTGPEPSRAMLRSRGPGWRQNPKDQAPRGFRRSANMLAPAPRGLQAE